MFKAHFLGGVVEQQQMGLHISKLRRDRLDHFRAGGDEIVTETKEAHIVDPQDGEAVKHFLLFAVYGRSFIWDACRLAPNSRSAAQVVRVHAVRAHDDGDGVTALGVQTQCATGVVDGVSRMADDGHYFQFFVHSVLRQIS
jgi:hypothetical protein